MTSVAEESSLNELTAEAAEEITEEAAAVEEELTVAAEEAEESAEETEETVEEAQPKKGGRRLFLGVSMLEWVSTFAFCSVILHAGYLLGQAVQSGASGMGLITVALSNWYSCVYMVMLAVFGVLAGTVAKKKGTLCLLAPTVLYFGLTVYNLVKPVNLLVTLITGLIAGDETIILMGTQLVVPLIVLIVPYLLQAVVLISFTVRLFGRGNRWAHMVLSVLWAAFSVINVLMYLTGSFTQCAPQYMLALEFVATGLLVGVTGFAGASVAKAEYAALREADAAEAAAKSAKKSKKAEAPAEEESCECDCAEGTCDCDCDCECDSTEGECTCDCAAEEVPAEETAEKPAEEEAPVGE